MVSFERFGIVLLVILAFEVAAKNGQDLTVMRNKYKARIGKPQLNPVAEVVGNKATHGTGHEGRRLMESGSTPGCIWYEEAEVCESNFSVPAELFSNSSNKFARYLSNLFTCFSATNNVSCVEKGRCRWDFSSETCVLGFYTIGYEKSPCAKAAPAIAREYSTNIACQKHRTAIACNRGNNCTWLDDEEFCIADIFPIYFDLESYADFMDRIHDLYDAKFDIAWDTFIETYDTDSAVFNWKIALDWKVPKSSCPKGYTPTECNFVDAYLEVYLPVSLYCEFEFEDVLSCSFYPICTYDYEEDLCDVSDEVSTRANLNAISTLLDRVKAEVDRDVLTAFISCPTIIDHSECKEHCQWDADDLFCKANVIFVRSRISEAGSTTRRGSKDPVCLLFAFSADTNCTSIESTEQCLTTTTCEWKMTQTCDLSVEEYIQLALEKDGDVDASLENLWSDCLDYTTKQTCLAAEA